MERITTSVALPDLANCDLVIKAATEQVKIKQDIFGQLDAIIRPHTIVATNTSSVSVSKPAARLATPSRFVALHFFNPPPVMELVEIIRGVETSDDTWQAVLDLTEAIGKMPICVKNSPGFLMNRVLVPMVNEAILALQDGIAAQKKSMPE